MKVFNMNNKIFVFLAAVFVLITVSATAQQKNSVLLKFSKQDGLMRVVFEGEEAFINKIKVTTSPSQIKLDFSGPFELKSQKNLPFEIVPSEKMVLINMKEKVEVKFFRLVAPARLVLDIQRKEFETDMRAEGMQEKQQEKQPERKGTLSQPTKILIDAGHGGYDFGISFGSVHEKDISLTLAKDLGAALSKRGIKVFHIRKADQYVSLSNRIFFANQKTPDIFISLHASMSRAFVLYEPAFDEQSVHDYSLASMQRKYAVESKELSDNIEKAIRNAFKNDVIRRKMPLPIIHSIGAPSVFIEYPSPAMVAYDQDMKSRLVSAIIQGFTAYGL